LFKKNKSLKKIQKMRLFLIMSILILTACASWSTTDRALLGYGAGLHAFDAYCSYHYVDRDTELNGLLAGMKPAEAVGAMVLSFGIMYFLADYFKDYRTPILIGYGGVKTVITINNIKFGIP